MHVGDEGSSFPMEGAIMLYEAGCAWLSRASFFVVKMPLHDPLATESCLRLRGHLGGRVIWAKVLAPFPFPILLGGRWDEV
jgi:hypothetical protein